MQLADSRDSVARDRPTLWGGTAPRAPLSPRRAKGTDSPTWRKESLDSMRRRASYVSERALLGRKKRPTCRMSICSPGSSAQPAPTSAAVRAVTVVTGGSPAAGQLSATCLPCHSDPFPSAPTRSSFELAPLLTGHCLCQSHPGKLPSPGVPTVGSPWGLWRVTYFLRPALEATRRC